MRIIEYLGLPGSGKTYSYNKLKRKYLSDYSRDDVYFFDLFDYDNFSFHRYKFFRIISLFFFIFSNFVFIVFFSFLTLINNKTWQTLEYKLNKIRSFILFNFKINIYSNSLRAKDTLVVDEGKLQFLISTLPLNYISPKYFLLKMYLFLSNFRNDVFLLDITPLDSLSSVIKRGFDKKLVHFKYSDKTIIYSYIESCHTNLILLKSTNYISFCNEEKLI